MFLEKREDNNSSMEMTLKFSRKKIEIFILRRGISRETAINTLEQLDTGRKNLFLCERREEYRYVCQNRESFRRYALIFQICRN